MTLSVKPGVIIQDLHPAMVVAVPTIVQVFARFGYETTITEGNDTMNRQHRSYHRTIPLQALDFRTWADENGTQMDDWLKAAIVNDLRRKLGPDYDVLYGPVNIHVEFDPK